MVVKIFSQILAAITITMLIVGITDLSIEMIRTNPNSPMMIIADGKIRANYSSLIPKEME